MVVETEGQCRIKIKLTGIMDYSICPYPDLVQDRTWYLNIQAFRALRLVPLINSIKFNQASPW